MNFAPVAVNLKGIQPGGVFIDLPTGVYPVTILDVAEHKKAVDGSFTSYRFSVTVRDGSHKGAPQDLYIGSDFSKDGSKKSLVAALLSAGLQPAQIDGEIKWNDDTFRGKSASIYVQEAPEGSDEYSDKKFVTADMAAILVKVPAAPRRAAAPAGATATGTQTAAAPPQAGNFALGAPNGTAPTATQTPQPTGGELGGLLR